mgnify:CR=1 FL=1
MSDLISKQAAIDALKAEYEYTNKTEEWSGLEKSILIIEGIPFAEQERGKGRWVENIYCSECGFINEKRFNFCPRCGSDMRGK